MIDRKKPPKIISDFDLSINGLETSALSNGIGLYEIKAGSQPVVKIDLILGSGRVQERVIGSAKAAITLIREGSVTHSAEELAKEFDFYGAVIKNQSQLDQSNFSLVVLEKHFSEIWPIWMDMIRYPLYEASEIDKYVQLTVERMQVQQSQNDVLAYRKITEHLFGATHPYGYNTEIHHVRSLGRDGILDYYNHNMTSDNMDVILSGNYSSSTRALIVNSLENLGRKKKHYEVDFTSPAHIPQRIQVPTSNELQTSIKMALPLFNYYHEDYSEFKMMNVVLGGYFGSRLMKNIREDKGYTYGIYSASHCLKHGGYFYISADVGNEHLEATIEEIHKEMKVLKEELVSDQELRMVKNYVNGQMLTSLDGPFAKAHLIRNLVAKDLTLEDHDNHISRMAKTSKEDIRALANKYLIEDNFSIVCAGTPNT